jgi:hypothetical protein
MDQDTSVPVREVRAIPSTSYGSITTDSPRTLGRSWLDDAADPTGVRQRQIEDNVVLGYD